jgi:hypothetical protein
MSWKMFGQIVLLIVIGALVLMLMKCAMMQCPIMGKSMKYCTSCPTCSARK